MDTHFVCSSLKGANVLGIKTRLELAIINNSILIAHSYSTWYIFRTQMSGFFSSDSNSFQQRFHILHYFGSQFEFSSSIFQIVTLLLKSSNNFFFGSSQVAGGRSEVQYRCHKTNHFMADSQHFSRLATIPPLVPFLFRAPLASD